MAVDQITVQFGADLKDLERELRRGQTVIAGHMKEIQGVVDKAAAAFSVLGRVAAAVGAGLSLNFLKSTIDTVGGLGELAQQVGTTTDFLQEMQYAAVQLGMSSDDVNGALAKFARTVGDAAKGAGEGVEAFQRLGIGVRDTRGALRPTQDVLLDVADALARIKDPAAQAAMVVDLFGRSGQKLIPYLSEGSDGIRKFAIAAHEAGAVLSRDMIDGADRASDAMAKLDHELAKIGQTIVAGVGPALADFVAWINRLANPSLSQQIGTITADIARLNEEISRLAVEGGSASRMRTNQKTILAMEAERDRLQSELNRLTAERAAIDEKFAARGTAGGAPELSAQQRAYALRKAAEEADAAIKAEMDASEKAIELWKKQDAEMKKLGDDIRKSVQTPTEEYQETLRALSDAVDRGAIGWETYERAVKKATDKMNDAKDDSKKAESAMRDLGFVFQSAFEDAIVKGEKFSDVLRGLMQDITRVLLRTQLIEPVVNSIFGKSGGGSGGGGGILGAIGALGSIMGGGIFGSSGWSVQDALFAGLAGGGSMNANEPRLVGERGPEIFRPSTAGTIVPNGVAAAGAGGVVINYTIDARGADPGVEARLRAAIKESQGQTLSAVRGLADRGGQYAKALGRR